MKEEQQEPTIKELFNIIIEVADFADKMKELKYFTSRTKRQYEYFKSLKETSNNLNPKILKFIEDYENFYFKEDK